MKKVLLVIMGIMLILSFSLVTLPAEEITQGEEEAAVEATEEEAAEEEATEEEATEEEAAEEEAAEPGETESK